MFVDCAPVIGARVAKGLHRASRYVRCDARAGLFGAYWRCSQALPESQNPTVIANRFRGTKPRPGRAVISLIARKKLDAIVSSNQFGDSPGSRGRVECFARIVEADLTRCDLRRFDARQRQLQVVQLRLHPATTACSRFCAAGLSATQCRRRFRHPAARRHQPRRAPRGPAPFPR